MRYSAAAALIALVLAPAEALATEFDQPWNDDTAIVLDPYQGNDVDFDAIARNPRVVGFIHKATQGASGTDREYNKRRAQALRRGYLWGSYHLLTTDDPVSQVDRYLRTVGIHPEETYAIDVECLAGSTTCQSGSFRVPISQIERALRRFKERTGFFPLLYTNDSTRVALEKSWSTNGVSRRSPLVCAVQAGHQRGVPWVAMDNLSALAVCIGDQL
jgi:GH25 family lysozyme M1 (1,4-beta-N-acetylmuramidase)